MAVTIRPAVAADQPLITALVRSARLNSRDLHWPRFLVAEDNGTVVGIRQVKIHKHGTREVASGFVRPEYRHQGVSARLMQEVLAREDGPLYLMCNAKWAPYYEQFGFRQLVPNELPADFRREYNLGRAITSVLSVFAGERIRIIPMRRPA